MATVFDLLLPVTARIAKCLSTNYQIAEILQHIAEGVFIYDHLVEVHNLVHNAENLF